MPGPGVATVGGVERQFTVDEARAMLPEVRAMAEEFVALRAELATARHAQINGELDGLADLKAAEARLSELLDGFSQRGLEVKGAAPLLLDFPMEVGGRQVLLCWLEGERSLDWFHDAEHGFAGRRPLRELDV